VSPSALGCCGCLVLEIKLLLFFPAVGFTTAPSHLYIAPIPPTIYMVTRTTWYAVLWALLLSHTVVNRTLTQITLIDDVPRAAEHVTVVADQSEPSDHVPDALISEQINGTQFNGTQNQGNLTALCIRCSPGEYSTGEWCMIIIGPAYNRTCPTSLLMYSYLAANCTNKQQIKSALPQGLEASCTSGYCMLPLNCSLCPLGTYNDRYNASACLACRPGSYADRAGALNCTTCRAGSYEARNGSVRCQACGQGYYNPERGSTARSACRTCTAGTYCPDAETREPVVCQAGWYCPSLALPGPIPCPAGRYCPRPQMNDPDSCPAGFYCPREGMIAPQPCPMNHYCLVDTVTPEACSFLFASATQQTVRHQIMS
jgi:hypothetical protein